MVSHGHGHEVDCVGMTAASVCLWRHPAPRRAIRIRRPFRDEPFGALGAKLREDLHKRLREIHDRTGLTTLIVTHYQDEAMDISHRVAILNHGRIEQIGRPGDVSTAPISIFVREFLQ
jgi:sulfate transport system ATP-binding protein